MRAMPELPEVERAARALARVAIGVRIHRARMLHAFVGRRMGRARLARLAGRSIVRVERRGKHQLVELDDGSTLHVHFRMTGDWEVSGPGAQLPRYARFVLELENGTRIVLADPRALATVELLDAGSSLATVLGPDAVAEEFDAAHLHRALARRRIALKPALLDQRVVAGVGNIYAAEALWRARIDPRVRASSLDLRAAGLLVRAIRDVLARFSADAASSRVARSPVLAVYDRQGKPCRRCRTSIARITQAGRSTYWCPGCQVNRAPRRQRP
ncbi:MAG: Fpg/Nei family DNA glycosylase [Gemmatimonadaceae bacterium]